MFTPGCFQNLAPWPSQRPSLSVQRLDQMLVGSPPLGIAWDILELWLFARVLCMCRACTFPPESSGGLTPWMVLGALAGRMFTVRANLWANALVSGSGVHSRPTLSPDISRIFWISRRCRVCPPPLSRRLLWHLRSVVLAGFAPVLSRTRYSESLVSCARAPPWRNHMLSIVSLLSVTCSADCSVLFVRRFR